MSAPVLTVRNLVVDFVTRQGTLRAVDQVSFDVHQGETLALIGESGSGKSLSVLALLGLAPESAVVSGEAWLRGQNLLALSEAELRRLRGCEIAMVFQDPMTSLNPTRTIGWQLDEAIRIHRPAVSRSARRRRAADLLGTVGVPNPRSRLSAYPHEFSGGMRQRVVIAMAIANEPRVLLADEPTTALDVTIQAQVLDVLERARRETDAALVLITHDLALVSESADRVAVMYGGKLVEVAARSELFASPQHPYTVGLLTSLPRLDSDSQQLLPIRGTPPGLVRPTGCSFHPRCALGSERRECRTTVPHLEEVHADHLVACHFVDEVPDLVESAERELGIRLSGEEIR